MPETDIEKQAEEMFGGIFLQIIKTIEKVIGSIFSEARVDAIIAKVIDTRIDRMIEKL